jgi:predicted DNA-binding protein (MmcQ/YjbR family)
MPLKVSSNMTGALRQGSTKSRTCVRFAGRVVLDADLQDYLRESHDMVSRGLTKKLRAELGLA